MPVDRIVSVLLKVGGDRLRQGVRVGEVAVGVEVVSVMVDSAGGPAQSGEKVEDGKDEKSCAWRSHLG